MQKDGVSAAFAVNWDPPTPPDSMGRMTSNFCPSPEHLFFSRWVVFTLAYNSQAIVLVIPACPPRLSVDRHGVDISNRALFPSSVSLSLSTQGTEIAGPNWKVKLAVWSELDAFRMRVSCGRVGGIGEWVKKVRLVWLDGTREYAMSESRPMIKEYRILGM
jgi:hypothetical protein